MSANATTASGGAVPSIFLQHLQPRAQQPPRPAQSCRRSVQRYQSGSFLHVLKARSSVPTDILPSSSQSLCARASEFFFKSSSASSYALSRHLVASRHPISGPASSVEPWLPGIGPSLQCPVGFNLRLNYSPRPAKIIEPRIVALVPEEPPA